MNEPMIYDRKSLKNERARSYKYIDPYNESVVYGSEASVRLYIQSWGWRVEATPDKEDGTVVPRIKVWSEHGIAFSMDYTVMLSVKIATLPKGYGIRTIEIPPGAIEVVSTGWTCLHDLDLSTAVIDRAYLIFK
jgi:hypothetical protein